VLNNIAEVNVSTKQGGINRRLEKKNCMRSFIICILGQMMKSRMTRGIEGHVAFKLGKRKTGKGLLGNPEGKTLLGRHRNRLANRLRIRTSFET
jgi:hypothetical protein